MKRRYTVSRRSLRRRAFIGGVSGVSLALPFLEGLPQRSAWAAGDDPIFSLFICAMCGVVPERFFPQTGALTTEGLAAAGVATSELSAHAEHLLFLSGIGWPHLAAADSHSVGCCQALTAAEPYGTGATAIATGPSADVEIASRVHPDLEPLALGAGPLSSAYIGNRLSFTPEGQVRPSIENPYDFYLQLVGLAEAGGVMTPEAQSAAQLLLQSRKSVHDLLREELGSLVQDPRLSLDDKQRLELHLDSIRDAEIDMGNMGVAAASCSFDGVDVEQLSTMVDFRYTARQPPEGIVDLHMSLTAVAFACNYRRSATLQWGTPYDGSVYDVPSNTAGNPFSYIGHRTQSDSGAGPIIPDAEEAHAEIDVVRMRALAAGLEHFKTRGLQDHSYVMWTNHFQDGPAHSFRNIPHIVWGSGGGYLKQAEHISLGQITNGPLLNTLITAAIQDTGAVVDDFGDSTGGLLEEIIA